jgi:hypothetical protein
MEKGRRELLKRVPTRKLVASIKKELRRQIKAAAAPVKRKKK